MVEQPSRKKQKLSASSPAPEYLSREYISPQQLVLEELDSEIAIKQRIQDTINSRITWALLLQQSLDKRVQQTIGAAPFQNVDEFRTVAMEALQTSEAPITPILSREAASTLPRSETPSISPCPELTSNGVISPSSRPQTRQKRQGLSLPSRPTTKLLFLRNTSLSPPAVAKLACPDCERTDFPRVQGLLNHCRLTHGRDFGSHDECIRNCAVVVPDEEKDWVVANGAELAEASLPSLRRLFEIAVGGGGAAAERVAPTSGGVPEALLAAPEKPLPSTHLSRTLGHHIDSPALAPFLGRAPKRRHIAVHDESGGVDIEDGGVQSDKQASKPRWCMLYTHRSSARPALDVADDAHELNDRADPERSAGSPTALSSQFDATGSRFHILARILISDRSLWLPINRRLPPVQEHTHRWMISVESPSYSLNVSAFLAKMTVSCLTDPPPSSFSDPIVVTSPPFAAIATTDRPFLAKVTLTWVGSQNPPMEAEHWVELDPFKSTSPVLGDEQVLDVELDRHTELLPVVPSTSRIPRSLWDSVSETKDFNSGRVTPVPPTGKFQDTLPRYVALLRSLIPRFPLTMREMKGRIPPPLPYRLVSTPAQFRALVPGRRKAIEWGRARAISERYEEIRKIALPDEECLPLSIGDIFCWLEDEGLSLRPPPLKPTSVEHVARKKNKEQRQSNETDSLTRTRYTDGFCTACGLNMAWHASYVKQEAVPDTTPCPFSSAAYPRLPVLDIHSLLGGPADAHPSQHHPSDLAGPKMRFSAQDWSSAIDPSVIRAVNCWVDPLKLDFVRNGFGNQEEHMDGRALPPLASAVAPSAALGLALQAFVRQLVQDGLAVLQADTARARGMLKTTGRHGRTSTVPSSHGRAVGVLAPSHVARGMHLGSSEDHVHGSRSTGLALSLLGVLPRMARAENIVMATHGAISEPGKAAVVKLEGRD